MTTMPSVDGVLVQWGERLFYPGNRIVKGNPTPRLATLLRRKAAVIRKRIQALAVRRAPEVMVKVAGGGRGMRAIAAQFSYITRNGELELEDDRGVRSIGTEALRDQIDQWRYGGSLIEEVSQRREAINVTLSMPAGTDPERVLRAARAFARAELAESRYVFVLHRDRDHPHVHLLVRAQARSGERINVWTQRHRWRETFAAQLRNLGVDAEATSQACRGANRGTQPSWRRQPTQRVILPDAAPPKKAGNVYYANRAGAMHAWSHIITALSRSVDSVDRQLAVDIAAFIRDTPFVEEALGPRQGSRTPDAPTRTQRSLDVGMQRSRSRPDICR